MTSIAMNVEIQRLEVLTLRFGVVAIEAAQFQLGFRQFLALHHFANMADMGEVQRTLIGKGSNLEPGMLFIEATIVMALQTTVIRDFGQDAVPTQMLGMTLETGHFFVGRMFPFLLTEMGEVMRLE
jgi:hypothetical protein